jgi:hypothetical protein
MPASQVRPTFIVPDDLIQGTPHAPKTARDAAPFVLVPSSLVTSDEREALEPHWLPAIDLATD